MRAPGGSRRWELPAPDAAAVAIGAGYISGVHSTRSDQGWDEGGVVEILLRCVATGDPQHWELLELCASRLAASLGDTCVAAVLSDDRRWLHPLGLADPDPGVAAVLERLAGARTRTDQGLAERVLSTQRPVRLQKAGVDAALGGRPELEPYLAHVPAHSLISAPLLVRGTSTGTLTVVRSRDTAAYSSADERYVQTVADALAIALRSSAEAAAEPASELPAALSAREREILKRLALGHTNRETADQLGLSVRTIEWHRSRLQYKLGASGRAQLAAIARNSGLIA